MDRYHKVYKKDTWSCKRWININYISIGGNAMLRISTITRNKIAIVLP